MEKEIKAIIVDDENSARNILEKFLEVAQTVEIVASVSNTKNAYKALEKYEPDVIFLDINMLDENGLEFAQSIREAGYSTQLVFTTAYERYASEAFPLKPIDYLVKPFGIDAVFDVVTKLQNFFIEEENRKKENQLWGSVIPEKIKFKTHTGYFFVKPEDIFYIQIQGVKLELVLTSGKSEELHGKMKEVYQQLEHLKFYRINRSVVVNLNYIERIERKTRACHLFYNNSEKRFIVARGAFKVLENMKSIRIG